MNNDSQIAAKSRQIFIFALLNSEDAVPIITKISQDVKALV